MCENNNVIPDIKRVPINEKEIRQFRREKDFIGLSIDLLIEVGSFVCVAANLYPSGKTWNRDEAILGGHFVRLYKLISAILDQTCQYRREIIMIHTRLAFECIINLRYIINHASKELFDSYVKYSLQHEKKLKDLIERNINDRSGDPMAVEKRMLDSINRMFKFSNIKPDEISSAKKMKNWGNKNIYEKAEALRMEQVYLAAIGGGSHSVHGNWSELLEFHLIAKDPNCFEANLEWHPPRPQILNAVSLHCCFAIYDYLQWLGEDLTTLMNTMRDLEKRIRSLDSLHEEFLTDQ